MNMSKQIETVEELVIGKSYLLIEDAGELPEAAYSSIIAEYIGDGLFADDDGENEYRASQYDCYVEQS